MHPYPTSIPGFPFVGRKLAILGNLKNLLINYSVGTLNEKENEIEPYL